MIPETLKNQQKLHLYWILEKKLETPSQERAASLRASRAFLLKIAFSSATCKFNAL
jgi:hypothetical protein